MPPFEFDLRTFELRRDGRPLKLHPQPARVLALLVRHAGEVVRREDIQKEIWGEETFVDFELGINSCIKQIRTVLRDDADQPRYVQTVPREGYRLIAPVEVLPARGPNVSDPRKPPRRIWFAAMFALGISALVVLLTIRPRPGAEPYRAVALTTFPGAELHPSISPDGRQVAFMWTGPKQDNPDIYVQRIGGAGSPLRLTTDARTEYGPAWSPDGDWIAFLRLENPLQNQRGLWLVPPLGGAERKLADVQVRVFGTTEIAGFLSWCPDGECLVVTDSAGEGIPDALVVVSTETGEKRSLTHPAPPLLGDTQPAVSPDGHWLAFRRLPAPSAGEIHLLRLEKGPTAQGEPRRLTLGSLDAAHPAWMPDSDEILFSSGPRAGRALFRLSISGSNEPSRLLFVGEDGRMPAVSRPQPGGPSRLVYVRGSSDLNIWRVDTTAPGVPASSPPVVAISSTRIDILGDFSPDGRRVVFSSNRTGTQEIWTADPDGADAFQVTFIGNAMTAAPRWSPDGGTIAFQSNFEGQFDIYVVPGAGGKVRRITSQASSDHAPSFSRDGKSVYFASNRTGAWQIWKIPATGGNAVQVTTNGGFLSFESEDGAFLYYAVWPELGARVQGRQAGPTLLWRIPTTGGEPGKLLEGIIEHFFVLEQGIYYIEWDSSESRLRFFDFATGRCTTVARNLGTIGPLLTATADGRTILFTREDSSGDDLMLVEDFR
jgi:Tol biopolymer transport system component/DNA-binding winged helix-turn-helix (wHTH) protein